MQNNTVCSRHNYILNEIKYLKKQIKNNKLTSEENINILNKILSEIKLANKSTQHMEDRLYEYKNTIESLGFERKKRLRFRSKNITKTSP